jgi:hypothetical protein
MSLETVGPPGDITNHPRVGIATSTVIFTTSVNITTITVTVEITMVFVVVVADIILVLCMEALNIMQPPTD